MQVLCPLLFLVLIAQHSTAQHSTAQHSTAQHSTAQHSTAQHSTAQQGTAVRCLLELGCATEKLEFVQSNLRQTNCTIYAIQH